MQLINKTDKILSGSISKTGDFEMYKKVIGVNSSNLKSNAQGIVPLANTSSLEKEKVESEISVPVMESLDLGSDVAEEKVDIPSIDLGSLSLGQKDQEPDLQGAVPVSVSDTSSLESIDLPKIPSLDSPIESQNIEAKKEVIPDLELPNFSNTKLDMPVVPKASSEMFIDSATPSLENKSEAPKVSSEDSSLSVELPKMNGITLDDSITKENIDVKEKFKSSTIRKEQMLQKIMSFISDEIDLYLSETQKMDSSKTAVVSENHLNERKIPDMTNMVDTMINQIQDNPELPEEGSKLSI